MHFHFVVVFYWVLFSKFFERLFFFLNFHNCAKTTQPILMKFIMGILWTMRKNIVYTNIIKLKSFFFCLKWNILFVLDSPFIEEGYRLYDITLLPIGAEHKWKMFQKRQKNIPFWELPLRALRKRLKLRKYHVRWNCSSLKVLKKSSRQHLSIF